MKISSWLGVNLRVYMFWLVLQSTRHISEYRRSRESDNTLGSIKSARDGVHTF